ncbi:MAG: beta-hydroxyacyl-ACP dehydratase [Planctomycetota bacterium]|nr:beta-hydroxyacyl-ACP dehydratase [Planctomycetaceae bacterium]MDQ3330200.1 beta-hydroxyacyl-ACP dehydratase [Planctomycetota bacterium]
MRWIWIDRFLEFESGKRAVAVKNVTLAEEHLHDHIPGFAVMPGSLMIEGMAQTGGILLGEKNAFRHIVILAKVPKMTFHGYVVPGDSIHYAATLTDERPEGGSVEVRATVGETLVAEGEIMFAHIAQNDPQFGNINQKNFVFNSGLMGVFEVGKA